MSAGAFEVVRKSDPSRLLFQPHYEFWRVEREARSGARVLLGVCLAPQFVTESMGLPGDPACFALAPDGSALVYFHRPEIAGAAAAIRGKPSGLYRSGSAGDSLVYTRSQIGQLFSRAPVPAAAMRVSWHARTPSAGGARCGQRLVVFAAGGEQAEGEPQPRCAQDSVPPSP